MPYRLHRNDNDTYWISGRADEAPLTIDDHQLTGLSLVTATAYLYALNVLEGIEVTDATPAIRSAIERGLRASSPSRLHVEDVMVSVRWMLPDVNISSVVLRALIVRVARERGVILVE